jgi:hypothetical protein
MVAGLLGALLLDSLWQVEAIVCDVVLNGLGRLDMEGLQSFVDGLACLGQENVSDAVFSPQYKGLESPKGLFCDD